MGNTETRGTVNNRESLKAQTKYQDHKRNLKVNLSEEDYLPMSLSMRKALVDGRRFQHVVPGKESPTEVNTNQRPELQGNITFRNIKTSNQNGSLVSGVNGVEESEQFGQDYKVFEDKHGLQPTKQTVGKRNLSYSGYKRLTKSRFTLEMEEKLRQSKFELLDLSSKSWNEFSYKPNNLKSPRRKSSSVGTEVNKNDNDCTQIYNCHKSVNEFKTANIKDKNIKEYDEKHLLRDNCKCELCVLSYLTDIKLHMSSSLEKTKTKKSDDDLQGMLQVGNNKDCYYQVETSGTYQVKNEDSLIFITESAGSSLNEDSTNRRIRELFLKNKHSNSSDKAKKNCFMNKNTSELNRTEGFEKQCPLLLKRNPGIETSSLEAAVYPETEHHTDTVMDMSSPVSEQHNVDQENAQISVRKCFYKVEQNCSNVDEIDCDRMMWIGLPVAEKEKDVLPVSETDVSEQDASNFFLENSAPLNGTQKVVLQGKFSQINHKNLQPKKSSSVQFETSPSSSLATIMSYRRVRKIFQTIIETNQPRRRKMRNIAEFRNMEELGLGKVYNRRWYPSADKTLSIWSSLHDSLSGVQAQFRKYHKPV